jgi:AraC family transcriptional regulator
MLRYLGLGYRRFGLQPTTSPPRMNWEFYAVVNGRCAPVPPGGPKGALRANTLWVSAPGSAHGWTGAGKCRAYITAFHFGLVPPQLEAAVRRTGQLAVTIEAPERRRLVELAKQARAEFDAPTHLCSLLYQGILCELSLLVLRKLPEAVKPLPASRARRTADAAVAWFVARLDESPSLSSIAKATHVSVSTLRRAFLSTRGETPHRAFARLRLETAMRLMIETPQKLEEIAAKCGYAGASDFGRAFKAATQVSPAVWRRTILEGPGYIRR